MSYSISKTNYYISSFSFGNNASERNLTDFGIYAPTGEDRGERLERNLGVLQGPQVVTDSIVNTSTNNITIPTLESQVQAAPRDRIVTSEEEIVDQVKDFLLKERVRTASGYVRRGTS